MPFENSARRAARKTPDFSNDSILKGLPPSAQGCRVCEATLGYGPETSFNPERVASIPDRDEATPLGLMNISTRLPRVASSQPGAERLNPLGILIWISRKALRLAASLILLAGAGCHKPVPTGALVLAQSPATTATNSASDILDLQCPSGSRVVLMEAPLDPNHVRVLSEGLAAAGEPIVSYDGQNIFFAGKASAASDWQIYQEDLTAARLTKLTSIPGGAMSPALLPDGSIVFASPVPKIGGTNFNQSQPALYVQSPGGKPRQLTFSSRAVTEPTMLADGRILFGSPLPAESSNALYSPAVGTINSDGT